MDGQKTPIAKSLQHSAGKTAGARDYTQPKAWPVSIAAVGDNNQTLTLKFETDPSGFTLPQAIAPVWNPRYVRYPWSDGKSGKPADKGVLLSADLFLGGVSGLGPQGGAPFVNPGNLSPMLFVPLGNTSDEKPDNPNAVQHNGPEGTVNRDDSKKSQHVVHPDGGVTAGAKGDGQGNYANTHSTNENGIQAKTPGNPNTIDASNRTVDQAGNMTNQGTHIAQGAISSATSMSAPSGNFAGGSMGGLAMLGGIMQSASSGGSTDPLMIDTGNTVLGRPSSVKARFIKTGGFTITALLALTTFTTSDAGTRAHVTDATALPTWGADVTGSGGGTLAFPVFWTGTKWIYA